METFWHQQESGPEIEIIDEPQDKPQGERKSGGRRRKLKRNRKKTKKGEEKNKKTEEK